MGKFTFKSEYFTTPLRLILPGVILSVIGGFLTLYVFNNPEKNKAKATFATWKVITQFEDIFEKNSDLLPCMGGDQMKLKKDMVHLWEMTRQNLLDLKSEQNIDKRLTAIINLKIDSYNELKKITEVFLDSARVIDSWLTNKYITPGQKDTIVSAMQDEYMNDALHISYRDTLMTKNILNELNQCYASYVDSFLVNEKIQTSEQIRTLLVGKWITADKITIEIYAGGKGRWKDATEIDFTWTLKDNVLTLDQPKKLHRVFEIYKISDKIVTFYFDRDGLQLIANACKI